MNALRAVLQITRIDSSILGFLGLFVPLYVRTGDVQASVGHAIPLLFICMCTFVANDLDDLDRDQINHPRRPLPGRHLSQRVAVVLYFTCLGLALFLTRCFVDQRVAFWYYALVTLSISYGYVIEWLPSLKAPYVASAVSVPVLIVAMSYPDERRLYVLAVASFLFSLGRELCMDIDDRVGDVVSMIHRIRPVPLAVAAFVVQTLALVLLVVQIRRPLDALVTALMAFALFISGVCWFKLERHKAAQRLMKVQLFVGLYFLA